MELFEKTGIILDKDEEIIHRGNCKGKAISGIKSVGFKTGRFEDGITLEPKWKNIKGEMVLTNKRFFVISEKERKGEKIIPSWTFEVNEIVAVSTKKPIIGKEKLLLTVIITEELETLTFEVGAASKWAHALKDLMETRDRIDQMILSYYEEHQNKVKIFELANELNMPIAEVGKSVNGLIKRNLLKFEENYIA